MSSTTPTEADRLWAAGVLDACGTIGIWTRADGRVSVRLRARSRHLESLVAVRDILGRGRLHPRPSGGLLQIDGRRGVRAALEIVRPHLRALRPAAQAVLDGVPEDRAPLPCAVAGCGAPVRARALCPAHYKRRQRRVGALRPLVEDPARFEVVLMELKPSSSDMAGGLEQAQRYADFIEAFTRTAWADRGALLWSVPDDTLTGLARAVGL